MPYTYVTSRLISRKPLSRIVFDGHQFVYRHVAKHLFFGYKSQDGLPLAEAEKAVLDFLYFTFKSQRSAIAPQDIDYTRLNPRHFRRYVRAYRQRGFEAYALHIALEGGLERGKER